MATRHGSSPAFSCSSTTSRSSRASEPWWARAIGSSASSFSRSASRSAARRLLTKISVERCSRDELEQLRVHRRPDRLARAPPGPRTGRARGPAAPARPSTPPARGSSGRAACARRCRRPCSAACGPTMKRPTSSSGFCVADSPTRWTSRPACSTRRSSVSARCAPRLVWATAWISSRITVSVPAKISRAPAGEHQVQRLRRGDQHVRRVLDHVAPLALRRVAGADGHVELGPDPAQRRAQVLLHVVGERLQRRDVDEPGALVARRRRGSGPARRGTRPASCPSRWARR